MQTLLKPALNNEPSLLFHYSDFPDLKAIVRHEKSVKQVSAAFLVSDLPTSRALTTQLTAGTSENEFSSKLKSVWDEECAARGNTANHRIG